MLNKKEECRNDAMRVRPELLAACPARTRRWLRVLLVLVAVSPASCCLLFGTSCHRYPPYLTYLIFHPIPPSFLASTCVACPADDDDEQETAR